MMIVPPRLASYLLLPCALAVSACGGESKVESREGATGEILPGSASDAMVPLDSVRSQAPLAPRATASGKAGGGSAAAASPAGPSPETATEAAAAPGPVATPDAE